MRDVFIVFLAALVPVTLVSAYALTRDANPPMSTPARQQTAFGDLTPLQSIAAAVLDNAERGDLATAESRLTDFRAVWSDFRPALQPRAPLEWRRIDRATEAAAEAMGGANPDVTRASAAAKTLLATLVDPSGSGADGPGARLVAGIAVTDGNGLALPCAEMIKAVTFGLAGSNQGRPVKVRVAELLSRAILRCDVEDVVGSNNFSAIALATLAGS
jgi:hypothetical protein